MFFEIMGDISHIELIVRGVSLLSRRRLRDRYGAGAWRKLKGHAQVRLSDGEVRLAEVHWYEAHGIGKKEFKIKKLLD